MGIQLAIRVILLEPEKAGNVGAIARSMKNFDLNDLWIVKPNVHVDGEARALAMHGLDVLNSANIVETIEEAIGQVNVVVGTSAIMVTSSSNLSRLSITPAQLAKKVATCKGRVGIVFGRESAGLSNQEVEACDFIVTIPASSKYNVLNIATAASIVFYEIFRNKVVGKKNLASRSSKRRLLLEFETLMTGIKVQSHKRRLARRAFRNVISRSFMSSREASLLLGVLRKVSAKVL